MSPLTWTRARACSLGNCVEVATAGDDGVLVRDSKQAGALDRLRLHFTPDEWDAFLLGVKAGEFDRDRLRSRA